MLWLGISMVLFVTLLTIAFYIVFNENKMILKSRMVKYTSINTNVVFKEGNVKQEKRKEKRTLLGTIGRILPLDNYFAKKKVILTGARLLIKPEELFGICLIAGISLAVLMFILFNNVLFMIVGYFLGFQIPLVYVKNVKKTRAKKLNNQLPEALSIIANGLRAGLSFNQAMVIAAKEMDDPIAEDLGRVVHENLLGKEMEEALKDFSERTGDEDVEILVTAVLIQRQVGGNLSEILDTIANTIRERVKLRGEIRTMTAQSKLSALIVGLIPPFVVIILYLLNREFMMPLFTTLIGNVLLGVAVFMQFLGIFVLVKLLDLKV